MTTAAKNTAAKPGLLVIGHGTRDALGQVEFRDVVHQLAQRHPGTLVRAAFLELVAPSIPEAINQLVAAEVTEVIAVPVLLLAAGHAKHDVPRALAAAAGQYTRTQFRLAHHLGCHDRVVELSARRFATARWIGDGAQAASARDGPPPGSLLLIVGRGTKDPETHQELARFVELQTALTAIAESRIGYLAMAQPSLDALLESASQSAWRDVVVQPHLLFAGELLTRLQQRVERAAAEDRSRRWWLAEHLGPDPLIVDALTARRAEATAPIDPGRASLITEM